MSVLLKVQLMVFGLKLTLEGVAACPRVGKPDIEEGEPEELVAAIDNAQRVSTSPVMSTI